jgi:hypothetical protein
LPRRTVTVASPLPVLPAGPIYQESFMKVSISPGFLLAVACAAWLAPGSASAAELVLTEVSVTSGSYPQGANLSIQAEIENTGNDSSGAFHVDFYASSNTSFPAGDRFIGSDNWPSIAAGEDASRTFNATIPANLDPGTYFIGGIISFSDSNSGDNINLDDEPITVTGTSNATFQISNTLNDAWYDPGTNGQGFFITVFPDIQKVFLAWFTYDTERPAGSVTAILGEPGHRWLTAFGGYNGDSATLDIELTQGGIFDANPPAPTQSPYGTIELIFNSCNEAELAYFIPSLGLTRNMLIQRTYASPDTVALCEALQTP